MPFPERSTGGVSFRFGQGFSLLRKVGGTDLISLTQEMAVHTAHYADTQILFPFSGQYRHSGKNTEVRFVTHQDLARNAALLSSLSRKAVYGELFGDEESELQERREGIEIVHARFSPEGMLILRPNPGTEEWLMAQREHVGRTVAKLAEVDFENLNWQREGQTDIIVASVGSSMPRVLKDDLLEAIHKRILDGVSVNMSPTRPLPREP